MPSESPKVRAEPHVSLLDTRNRVAPPIKDLTPTQSVPPITNIPSPNNQDTPYPKIISSRLYTANNSSSNDDRSLVEKNHTTSSISMVCTRWWTDINHIFYHFYKVGNRCTEFSNHTASVVEDNPNIVYEDLDKKEQDQIVNTTINTKIQEHKKNEVILKNRKMQRKMDRRHRRTNIEEVKR